MSARLPRWQTALATLVEQRMHAPFAWGSNDCAMFAADCVRAVTGSDPAAGLRHSYATADGAARHLREFGGVFGVAQARFGPQVAVDLAQVGDVVMVNQRDRDALAVCMGDHVLAPGELGLTWLPMASALCAWRCEREG